MVDVWYKGVKRITVKPTKDVNEFCTTCIMPREKYIQFFLLISWMSDVLLGVDGVLFDI